MLGVVLKATGLTKTYHTPSGAVHALRPFDHDFESGTVTAVVGPSGSGKSTLLNLLAGFDLPSEGKVTVDGADVHSGTEVQRAQLRLDRFGFVFQSYNLVAVLSARQNVELPMGLRGVTPAVRRRRSLELLAHFGLAARADHLPMKLSGGERQRVALARALANDPSVLFADEPTGSLDSATGQDVLAALWEVADEGRTVVLVTHDEGLAGRASVRLRLHDGRLVAAVDQRSRDPAPDPDPSPLKASREPVRSVGLR